MENVKVFKLSKQATLPTRNKESDAGLDLYAVESTFIGTGKTVLVKTSVAIQIPEGYVGKIEDRSSLSSKGLRTGGGVIDAGYTGEVAVVLHNLNNTDASSQHGRGYMIEKGQKIAQLLVYKVETPGVEEVTELWTSDRGSSGFGSSGA